MKVRELIKELCKYNEDDEVIIEQLGIEDVERASVYEVYKDGKEVCISGDGVKDFSY